MGMRKKGSRKRSEVSLGCLMVGTIFEGQSKNRYNINHKRLLLFILCNRFNSFYTFLNKFILFIYLYYVFFTLIINIIII